MTTHSSCARLRLVDRCVSCNPGYSDNNQAYWIYEYCKREGCDLRTAERAYIAAHQKGARGRWMGEVQARS